MVGAAGDRAKADRVAELAKHFDRNDVHIEELAVVPRGLECLAKGRGYGTATLGDTVDKPLAPGRTSRIASRTRA